MNIAAIDKIEDCFDGSTVYAYSFDQAWTREQILRLRALGEVDYYPKFPRPFFRLRGEGGLQFKGVEGEDTARMIFPKRRKEELQQEFEAHFSERVTLETG